MSSITGIYKHTILVEVLTDREDISGWSLSDLGAEMNFGEFMGVKEHKDVRELSREELIDEAYKMGGDPGFFGEEYGEEEDGYL